MRLASGTYEASSAGAGWQAIAGELVEVRCADEPAVQRPRSIYAAAARVRVRWADSRPWLRTGLRAAHRRDGTMCRVSDDHIGPRRHAIFMARSILREVRDGALKGRSPVAALKDWQSQRPSCSRSVSTITRDVTPTAGSTAFQETAPAIREDH